MSLEVLHEMLKLPSFPCTELATNLPPHCVRCSDEALPGVQIKAQAHTVAARVCRGLDPRIASAVLESSVTFPETDKASSQQKTLELSSASILV